eukprot:TRINITY_DN5461_c0_g3_i1.p1 TRINITY_DN5461_c0_g3~~TRINITY_DN5461_c0_g3_i1.p1  ORF type:complete len:1201 (+),score=319.98 TRINITY_DN5461_c0_g3_i1:58-3603(+)
MNSIVDGSVVDWAYGYLPAALTIVVGTLLVMVAVPILILVFSKGATTAAENAAQARKPRKFRKPKWTLDDPTQKRDTPMEMRGKASIEAAVNRFVSKRDDDSSDTDSDEEQLLTPEEILKRANQDIPREPNLGIFIGVDDPCPTKDDKKNPRCAQDSRDIAEALEKQADYRVFTLHDHKSHKNITDSTSLPTRLNIAHLLRTLKDGKYDDATRKKPNTSAWDKCLIYLSTRVRITTYGNQQKSETMEFLVKQEMELDPVWIDMVELVNKLSDIPFRQLFVVLDVVHDGKDDIAFEDGEDRPNPGNPCSMSEILRRTGVLSGIVNSQRCSVFGMTRPESMPRELPGDLLPEGVKKVKVRNGPMVHFLLAGLKEVEKRDPNAEMWKNLGSGGGMGGFGMMPTVAPVTSGDLAICPFHCGDMTVDSLYRFMSKRIRILLKNPIHDPAYHQGCVKMSLAVQKAIRPRDTPETPAYMHECKREDIKKQVFNYIRPSKRCSTSVGITGASGVGKSSIMRSTAWTKETLDYFSDGVFYFSLRFGLKELEKKGVRFLHTMQQQLSRNAAGFEGMIQTLEDGEHYLSKHFCQLKTLLLFDDVVEVEDVKSLMKALGIEKSENPMTTIIITTTSQEVASKCEHTIEVPPLTDDETAALVSSAAGFLSPDDLPKEANSVMKAFQNSPLFAVTTGSCLRLSSPEAWGALSEELSKGDKLDAVFNVMPELNKKCLKKLAAIPEKRAVAIPALLTLWQEEVTDWNQLYAVLAQLLDYGVGSLVIEEDYSLLLHPVVVEYLKKGYSGNPDNELVELYQTKNGITATDMDSEKTAEEKEEELKLELERWVAIPWDGYFHSHMSEHLLAARPELAQKLYSHPYWILAQHDACGVDKLLSNIEASGRKGTVVDAVAEALTSAKDQLRRHPWEIIPQLVGRLAVSPVEEVQFFAGTLREHSRPAQPIDKHALWLAPMFGMNPFDPECNKCESEATCVGFYKEYIVTGHKDGTVQLWHLKDGKPYKQLKGHEGAVHGIVSAAGDVLATGSKDEEQGRRIRVWDIESGTGEVLGVLEKPPQGIEKPEQKFTVKVSLGRTGTDITDHDEEGYGYSTRHIITDTILVETEDDSEEINCHTFVGWDANMVATSLTFGCKIHEVKTLEHNGQFLVATGDSLGRMLLFRLMTNEVDNEVARNESDSE